MIGFPPVTSYPLALDNDRSLYLVYNTSEAVVVIANSAWSEDIHIQSQSADKEEIWANNGFANISGELFYYDDVGYDSNGKVNLLKRCARNLGGKNTQHNPVGTYVRGFVIAEHHNQIVKAIMKTEEFIGVKLDCDNLGVKDTLTRRIKELECTDICPDDGDCPQIDVDFKIQSSGDICVGDVLSYNVNIIGNYETFRLDFGDGNFTTSQSGTHSYSPNTNIDPVIFVNNNNCQIVLTDISRIPISEPRYSLPEPLFIPIAPISIPTITVPSISIPPQDISIPPVVLPCIDIPSFNFSIPNFSIPGFSLGNISINIPSFISITPVNIPSIISITPVNIPSIISITPISFPSIISIVGPNLPSVISLIGSLPSAISLIGSLPSAISIIAPSIPNISLIVPSLNDISLIVPSIPNISVIFPSIPDINVSVNVPNISFPNINVSVNFPSIPDISVIDTIPDTITVIDDIPEIITVIDNIPEIINVVDNIPEIINVVDNIPNVISVEFFSNPIPVDWGSIPTLNVDWGTAPSITCQVNCGGSASMTSARSNFRATSDDLEDDDLATVEMGYDFTGIPSEINLVLPDMPNISLVHNLPSEISIVSFPSVISFAEIEKIPELILNTSALPKSISIESTLPSIIIVESNIPSQINVVNMGIPSIISIESTLPNEISVVGMPDSISVVGFPDSIKVDPVEMVYKGAPIEMTVKVDLQSALGSAATLDGQTKYYIIPATGG